jgi:hypothetical protein
VRVLAGFFSGGTVVSSGRIRSDLLTQSAEDSARAILRIFSAEDVRAGHVLMYEAVNVQFRNSYLAEDFAAGLTYAIEGEWLSNENTMIRLTKSGFDESQKLNSASRSSGTVADEAAEIQRTAEMLRAGLT